MNELQKMVVELLRERTSLFLVKEEIARGVIGEDENILRVFLACLTRSMPDPVSILVKGPSASGKSNLVRNVLKVMPPEVVIERSSFSPQALVSSDTDLTGKIVYLTEFEGGKESRYHLRQLQSEGTLLREVTEMKGRKRKTTVLSRVGRPVLITTTTADHVFRDDDTRFFSIPINQSIDQTRAIFLKAIAPESHVPGRPIECFQAAVRALTKTKFDYVFPPFFRTVARMIPASVGSRRDGPKLVSLCQAIALAMSVSESSHRSPITVGFSHYAVAYQLLNGLFIRNDQMCAPTTSLVVDAVRSLAAEDNGSVSVRQIMPQLKWSEKNIKNLYKHLELALGAGLISTDGKAHRNNEKHYLPQDDAQEFLVSPKKLIELHPELRRTKFIDPVSGQERSACELGAEVGKPLSKKPLAS